ncbi:cytochrome c553 [Mesorhizobium soli]|uniref:cytochrome c n=1 Tax=Pseudaminobacter soli (ex Li et al. 2025) TaxID=1295366 RepID=UPI00247656AC|nr:cytochrome c [Mesorhizobium soli]MDH6233873.1 cytochrome c553 [Mesorhizobium soli]
MGKRVLITGLLMGAILLPGQTWPEELPVLKSVHVDLPSGDSQFPGGADADAINNNCLACHSTEMVLNQPALPRATWEAEVHKMINAYKAPIDNADIAPIIDYLARTKGTD